jgi:hypothetical protein
LSLGSFLGMDAGGHAAYQVESKFPGEFQRQTFSMQFDWHDSG